MLVHWLGRVDYADAWERQRDLHAAVVAGDTPDTLLLLEHPPVYTAGRRTEPWERPTDGTPVVDVDRGGRITWHGPGQLVGYPVVRLPPLRPGGDRDGLVDVVAHVRRVEDLLLETCAAYGVTAERVDGRSGVWVRQAGRPDAKLGAVGIRVARGVSMHGFALNADCDLTAYAAITACGIADATVTSLSEQAGRPVTVADLVPLVTAGAGLLAAAAAGSRGGL